METAQQGADGMSVLIVDDSEMYAYALSAALGVDGYQPRIAHSAADAMTQVRQHRPECVLMDFGMPGADGLDLVKALRGEHQDDIVIIMVTGHDAREGRVAEAAALVDHHFLKPMEMHDLRRILPPRTGVVSL